MPAWVEQARDLRERDPKTWTYRALGERFGVTQGSVEYWLRCREWKLRNRDRMREYERGRRDYKRAWGRENDRSPCPECGKPMGVGSARKGVDRCWDCYLAAERRRVDERARLIVAWWHDGLSLKEIARRLDWSVNHLGEELDRLRGRGYDLPYRYRLSSPKRRDLARTA